ncbi:hypothetical protein [Telmatospirillum sp.]|uniref:hypothetical protein n=1 Tax=Telmatospirillum sp. TaxID=2079197 RepID=UPI00284DB39B|nr:hypothetical protein [Telmatospirillum sp.]MDR3438674.1 hypothetical protein [Telmatospirillum sp.]
MNKGFVVVFALLLTACTGNITDLGALGKNQPRILTGSDSEVVLYDPRGIGPDGGQETAQKYCAGWGKTAEWKSRGGEDSDCVSSQLNYCATYTCK